MAMSYFVPAKGWNSIFREKDLCYQYNRKHREQSFNLSRIVMAGSSQLYLPAKAGYLLSLKGSIKTAVWLFICPEMR